MIYKFEGKSIPTIWPWVLDTILDEGKIISPRGLPTKEISPVIMQVTRPRERLFGHPHRKEVSIFTYIEGLWMLLGEETPDRVVHYVSNMKQFVNEDEDRFDGAYGPRMVRLAPLQRFTEGNRLDFELPKKECYTLNQLNMVYDRLSRDPNSRQAIVVINNPLFDWSRNSKDIPCTLSFQFLIRDNKLDMIATMRSQDAWWGMVYDQSEFQWFQEIIAGWLGIDVGTYTHVVGSLHLYKKFWAKAQTVVNEDYDWNLYDYVKPLDARLDYQTFNWHLKLLDMIETIYRNDLRQLLLPESFQLDKYSINSFYDNLMRIIQAYNLKLKGLHKAAFNLLESPHSSGCTDLDYIYYKRWKK